ncbi:MAG: CPBP family intramembrane metalloprotease, partial [Eggerthellaceae bacterium]|nr:CPBP family intramembrane metalloprotease [Eggerthellaceae bacterium]
MLDRASKLSFAIAEACAIAYPCLSHASFVLLLGFGFDQDSVRLLTAFILLALTLAAYGLSRWGIDGPNANEEALRFDHSGLSMSSNLSVWIAGSAVFGILLALSLSSFTYKSGNVLSASAMYMLASGVIAPAAEELAFRGIVLCGLLPTLGVFKSLVISSVLLALSHGN